MKADILPVRNALRTDHREAKNTAKKFPSPSSRKERFDV